MSSNTLIGLFATGVWLNLGSPSSTSALAISGFVTQPYTLGTLNARIGTCFNSSGFMGTGVVFDTTPDITYSELAIVDALFRVTYYAQLATATMGVGGSSVPAQQLREGDSVIQFANIANLGEQYRESVKDWNTNLSYIINAYLSQSSNALSVDFYNPGGPWQFPYGNGAGVSYGG